MGRRFLNRTPDIIDDRIDVVMRGTMAATLGCARCHDHKFDPFTTKDYYGLYGIFSSSEEPKDLPEIAPSRDGKAREAYQKESGKLQRELEAFLKKKHAELLPPLKTRENLAKYLLAAQDLLEAGERELRRVSRKHGLRENIVARWGLLLKNTRGRKNPVFAPWHAYAKVPAGEFGVKAKLVMLAGKINPLVAKAFGAPPKSMKEVADRYAALLKKFDTKEKRKNPREEMLRGILRGPNAPVNIALKDVEALFNRADRNGIRGIRKKIDRLKVTHAGAPQGAQVLVDRKNPADAVIFLRGNSKARGAVVKRRFPEAFGGSDAAAFRDGSGRLQLAKSIASPENPLTARVMVNREWHHHFGAGLVVTPSAMQKTPSVVR